MQTIARKLVGGILVGLAAGALAGCSSEIAQEQLTAGMLPPVMNPITEINQSLRDLPPPSQKVVVAVYNYSDQTGQFKPSETTQTLSRAVTQGATSVLIKALQDVGNGSWFTVVERERIDNLLKERSIITQMRMTYLGEKQVNPKALPPLLFAGIIFEGGIIGFDSNIQTGGVGARLLGVGGDLKYRLDTITIYLRAVSTKTGLVVASVTTHKTIASVSLQGGVFKYIALDKILEGEAGFTKNEPDQLAVQQAIEKAVYSIIVEGSETNVWSFADRTAQSSIYETFKERESASSTSFGKAALAGAPPLKSAVKATLKNAESPAAGVTNEPKLAGKPQPGRTVKAVSGWEAERNPGWSAAATPVDSPNTSTQPNKGAGSALADAGFKPSQHQINNR